MCPPFAINKMSPKYRIGRIWNVHHSPILRVNNKYSSLKVRNRKWDGSAANHHLTWITQLNNYAPGAEIIPVWTEYVDKHAVSKFTIIFHHKLLYQLPQLSSLLLSAILANFVKFIFQFLRNSGPQEVRLLHPHASMCATDHNICDLWHNVNGKPKPAGCRYTAATAGANTSAPTSARLPSGCRGGQAQRPHLL